MDKIINPKCPYCKKEFEMNDVLYNPLSDIYGDNKTDTAGVVCPYCNEKYYIRKYIRYVARKVK